MVIDNPTVEMCGPLSQQSFTETFHDTHVNDMDRIWRRARWTFLCNLVEAFHVACVNLFGKVDVMRFVWGEI